MEDLPEMITSKPEMRQWSRIQKSLGKTVALVPTMGFLHDGHLFLIQQAKAHASTIVVSIYINPGQFAPTEDLSTYPSNLEGDLQKLAGIGGVCAVFCPENLYESNERKGGILEERKAGEVGTRRGCEWRGWRRGCVGRVGRFSFVVSRRLLPNCSMLLSRMSRFSGRRITSSGGLLGGWFVTLIFQ